MSLLSSLCVLVSLSLVETQGWRRDSWNSGHITDTPKFQFYDHQSHQNTYPCITHTKYCHLSWKLHKSMITSHRKLLRVCESAFALLELCGGKNVGSKGVFVFVIWDLKILPQAVSKLEAASEPDQLQMHLKDVVYENVWTTWPIDKVLDGNRVFIRRTKCQM